jgi:hypothetical protein
MSEAAILPQHGAQEKERCPAQLRSCLIVGFVLEHAPSDQVIEEHPDGCHVLLECGDRHAIGLGSLEKAPADGRRMRIKSLRPSPYGGLIDAPRSPCGAPDQFQADH